MKRYIKIPYDIEFNGMTRNKILYVLFLLKNDPDITAFRKEIYKTNQHRATKDYEEIKQEHQELLNKFRRLDIRTSKIKLPRHYKMKVKTYEQIKYYTKNELLITLWFLKKYQNTYQRTHIINIKDEVEEIFNNERREYRRIFLDTIEKLSQLEYDNNDVFIRSYVKRGKKLEIRLDEK